MAGIKELTEDQLPEERRRENLGIGKGLLDTRANVFPPWWKKTKRRILLPHSCEKRSARIP
jgi:hypothetical protein